MDIIDTYILPLKGPINDAFETYIVPLTSKVIHLDRRNRISISAAVALLGVYLLCNKVFRPPKSLRHLPRARFFGLNKRLIQGKSNVDIAHQVTLSVGSQSPYGLYLRFGVFGWSVHSTRPETARKIFQKTDAIEKIFAAKFGDSVLGRLGTTKSMIFLNGSHWKAHRRIANPAFHRSMPTELFGRLTTDLFAVIDNMLDRGTTSLDVPNLTERWTLDAIGLAGFDFNFHAISDEKNEWVTRYTVIIKNMFDPFYLIFPFFDKPFYRRFFPKRQKVHQEVTTFNNMIDGVIANKRKILSEEQHSFSTTNDSEKDLLTLMLEASKEGNGTLSDDELRADLIMFFIAGHDTTATALAYAMYHLAVNQDMQRRARKEVINVLGDEPEDVIPTAEQAREMPYINMIIKETLRINPPLAGTTPRHAVEDIEIEGTLIPKGTSVFTEIYELHHNPNVWKDPDTFNPDRFAPGGEGEQNGISAWQPFITGPRQCIGMNFSLAEQRVFLPMFLRKYEWYLPEDSIHKDGIVTKGFAPVAPKDLYIVFKRRH
ncbi:cytochrome P450 [Fennellomyces sp. T-0311]|nr:cytochrome P450 [Fennellomyces sp. T-0311]